MAEEKQPAPYGSWKSPITSDLIVSGTVSLTQIELAGDATLWIEGRAAEAGRNVLVRRDAKGTTSDVTPPPFNVRTRAHEYGGGAYRVDGDTVYFSNFGDNRLYRQTIGSEPQPLTPEAAWRYADLILDAGRNRLIAVREDHSRPGTEAANTIVAIDLSDGSQQEILASGNDFYAAPRLNPDGHSLSYLTWNHPNMPWDGTQLWVAQIADDGTLTSGQMVAGGNRESIFQPQWSPDGVLYFMSDRTGWWNPYRWQNGQIEQVIQMDAEFGQPAWAFDMSTYAFASARQMVCEYSTADRDHLATIDTDTKKLTDVPLPFTGLSNIRAEGDRAVFIAGSPTMPASIVQLNLSSGETQVLRSSSSVSVDEGYLSQPEAIEFPTENGLTAHAYFYPPRNKDFTGPAGQLPPLIVRSHGGPTGKANTTLSLNIQYWTSRGFAVADVNYGGSAGYGRPYRERLNGQWGVVDVDDCVNAARYLAEQGLVNPDQLIIVGGSAGGYTTLAALTFRDTFKAGASYFGLADLEPFVLDTHKFESRYLDGLLGPYPAAKEIYQSRSPINFTDQLSCPVILFQGLDDKIVPPNQAELMVKGLEAKGLPYAYVAFEGEGHGFRRAENIKRMMDGELYFYSRIFDFDLAEPVEPVEIENLG